MNDHPLEPPPDRVGVLEAEIASMRAEIAALRARQHPTPPVTTSRRHLIGAAAAAAVGAVAASAQPAAAADGEPLLQGQLHECTETTEIKFPVNLGAATPRSHVFVAQDGAWSTPASPTATTASENPFRASIAAFSGNHAMNGFYGQTNSTVLGSAGARFHGESAQAYGLVVSGRRATIRLRKPSGTPVPPPDRLDLHNDGEITLDSNNDLWVCVESGSPGIWRKLSGPTTAGSFHAITPVRVFDSRRAPIPGSGRFGAGTARTVSVATAYDDAGQQTASDVVPAGATAIAFNVTAVSPDSGGFLAVTPGGATSAATSTVNWTAGGAVVANGGIVGLDGSRGVALIAGPSATDVILDVTGYFR